MSAIDEIAAERRRQIDAEGWSTEHDDQHDTGELALAAGCYAFHAGGRREFVRRGGWTAADERHDGSTLVPRGWPLIWHPKWWKPKGARRDLIRAAALIVAEIERLDRASAEAQP